MIFAYTIIGFTGLLLSLTYLLGLAERRLLRYGPCKISINAGERVLEVEGGQTLLSMLIEAKVVVPSACGGKGSCGYCKVKVLSGGGALLPTEVPYLSRAEIRGHMRLACQVKVRSDLDIMIPDFLETVRAMVANKTFNPDLRWRWLIAPEMAAVQAQPHETNLGADDLTTLQRILAPFRDQKGSIVPILQQINRELRFLSEPALRVVAREVNLPLSHVYRIATFYNAFSLVPRGRNVIRVCLGTACYVKRGGKIMEIVERKLGIKVGQCTPDQKFSIETVNCIGCCGQSPAMCVNDEIYGYMRPEMIDDILDRFQ